MNCIMRRASYPLAGLITSHLTTVMAWFRCIFWSILMPIVLLDCMSHPVCLTTQCHCVQTDILRGIILQSNPLLILMMTGPPSCTGDNPDIGAKRSLQCQWSDGRRKAHVVAFDSPHSHTSRCHSTTHLPPKGRKQRHG